MRDVNGKIVTEFFSRVEYSDNCWEWSGYRQHQGYGVFFFNYKHKMAHRWSYEYFQGPIKDGYLICHHCDNPSCINPFHLFQGTEKDNALDAVMKGRHKEQKKTKCPKGHLYSGDNLILYRGQRYCRACRKSFKKATWKTYADNNREKMRENDRRYRERKKQALNNYNKWKEGK